MSDRNDTEEYCPIFTFVAASISRLLVFSAM